MKIRISKQQFFLIMWSYIIANDIIRGYYAREFKMDLTIIVPASIILSLILYFIYSFIYKNNNYDNFGKCIENILGKIISKIIFIIYPIYFIFITFFYVRDITDLIQFIYMDQAIIFLIGLGLLLVSFYIIYHGFEVFGRACTYIFAVSVFGFFIFSIAIFITNTPQYINLLPLLEHGIERLILPTIYQSYAIPMGELFALIILFHYVRDMRKSYKWGYLGILLAGLVFIALTTYNFLFLGVHGMSTGYSTAIRVMRRVEVEKILQRLDLVVLGIFIQHAIVKITVLLFASKYLLQQVIKVKKENIITIAFVAMITIALMFFGKRYTDVLLFRFNFVIPYVNLIFEVIIPVLIVFISFFRKKKKNNLQTA